MKTKQRRPETQFSITRNGITFSTTILNLITTMRAKTSTISHQIFIISILATMAAEKDLRVDVHCSVQRTIRVALSYRGLPREQGLENNLDN